MATDLIDAYYEEHSVYKSFIICDDEQVATELVSSLNNSDYSVSCILDDDLMDERPMYLDRLRSFATSMDRVFVTTYYVWHQISPFCQAYVLPYQNLIILYNMDHNMSRIVTSWLQQSQTAGFLEQCNILSV